MCARVVRSQSVTGRAQVTVRDVLSLPCLACAEVVAGAAGIDRPVRWIHVSELLEIARYLYGGEFLLTTGLKLKEVGRDEQREYAQSLVRRQIAALGLDLVLWLNEPPAVVVEIFEEEGIPLIVWKEDLRFSTITEEVIRLLFERCNFPCQLDEADLAEELLSGEILESVLLERTELCGLEVRTWLGVMVVELPHSRDEKNAAFRGSVINAIRHEVPLARRGICPIEAVRLACSGKGKLIKLVLTARSVTAIHAACNRVAATVRQVASRYTSAEVLIGVGRPRTRLSDLSDALREAVAVIRFQSRYGPNGRMHFEEIRLARLLLSMPPAEVKLMVREELGPLLALPAAERDEMIATLDTLLEENFSVSAAARRLHLHRQSLYRRMEKLEALLGSGLDRPERRTLLHLAVRAYDLFGVKGEVGEL